MKIDRIKLEHLISAIPIGKDNAIHQGELASRIGVTPSVAKDMVRSARHNGIQILSSSCGYWIAENDSEKIQFVMLMKKQAYSRIKSANTINTTIDDIKGQINLFDAFNEVSDNEQK